MRKLWEVEKVWHWQPHLPVVLSQYSQEAAWGRNYSDAFRDFCSVAIVISHWNKETLRTSRNPVFSSKKENLRQKAPFKNKVYSKWYIYSTTHSYLERCSLFQAPLLICQCNPHMLFELSTPHVPVRVNVFTHFSAIFIQTGVYQNLLQFVSNKLTPFGLGAYTKNGNLKETCCLWTCPGSAFRLFSCPTGPLQVFMPDLGPSPKRDVDV